MAAWTRARFRAATGGRSGTIRFGYGSFDSLVQSRITFSSEAFQSRITSLGPDGRFRRNAPPEPVAGFDAERVDPRLNVDGELKTPRRIGHRL
jgi:hypothetical protein